MNKLIALIVLLLTACFAFVFWYTRALAPVQPEVQTRINVQIEQGLSVNQIANSLYERGVIRSVNAFKLYVKFNRVENALQAGNFIFSPSLSTAQVVNALRTGKSEEMIVTIPEGFTVKEIDALLAQKDLLKEGEFLQCAQTCDFSAYDFLPDASAWADRAGQIEGYLYPDTYFVIAADFTAQHFANRLLSTFKQKIAEDLYKKAKENQRTLADIVTMASLIEKETRKDEERPVVSGILWKRYDAELGLGVDATVRYILNKPTDAITIADLNTNNPYNTRKFKGLPPGPIANPGYESIFAAANPKESEYWYYLHGDDGRIHYAVSNEEHNVNRYLYIQ